MPIFVWLLFLFAIGAAVGSFLNVCIARLPQEKSLLWPHSHCGHCYQPIRWYDNVPLLSYCWLRGHCRTCGVSFSFRYFAIELGTALGFAGLFYLAFFDNIHGYDFGILGPITLENPFFFRNGPTRADTACLVTFIHHAILFSFLMVATFCDVDRRTIPMSLTFTGILVGMVMAVLFPWPWPYTPAEALPKVAWAIVRLPAQGGFRMGLYFWPFWGVGVPVLQAGPLPPWFHPGGNWHTGLMTGALGLSVGWLMMFGIRFFFGLGLGPDYMEDTEPDDPGGLRSWLRRVGGKTLGLGDADLMAMAGAFVGWQLISVSLFMAVVPGLALGLSSLIRRGDNQLPFGPALAIGIVITVLVWPAISPIFQPFFFLAILLVIVVVAACVFMVVAGFAIRIMRLLRG